MAHQRSVGHQPIGHAAKNLRRERERQLAAERLHLHAQRHRGAGVKRGEPFGRFFGQRAPLGLRGIRLGPRRIGKRQHGRVVAQQFDDLFFARVHSVIHLVQRHGELWTGVHVRLTRTAQIVRFQRGEAFGQPRFRTAVTAGERLDHPPSTERALRRLVAEHESVAAQGHERLLIHDLTQRRGFGRQVLTSARAVRIQDDEFPDRLRGAQMNPHPLVVGDLAPRTRPNLDARIEARRGHGQLGMTHDVAAGQAGAVQPDQVERHALAPMRLGRRFAVHLERPHARFAAPGQHAHRLALAHAPGQRGAGHDHAVALEHEHAIHRQPEIAGQPRPRVGVELRRDFLLQPLDPVARQRRDRQDRRAFEHRVERENLDLLAHVGNAGRIHHVGLGDREHALAHAEQVQKVEMLLGLRHDPIVRGHGEQRQIDPLRTGQHVADEPFVAGHVDDAGPFAARQVQVGEAQVDGDAAFFFFLEPVGVLAGQGLEQRGLAVVDVAGGPDDVRHSEGWAINGTPR